MNSQKAYFTNTNELFKKSTDPYMCSIVQLKLTLVIVMEFVIKLKIEDLAILKYHISLNSLRAYYYFSKALSAIPSPPPLTINSDRLPYKQCKSNFCTFAVLWSKKLLFKKL